MKILVMSAAVLLLLWVGLRPGLAQGVPRFFGEAPAVGDLPLTQSLETRDPAAAAGWFVTRLGFAEVAKSAAPAVVTLERAAIRLVLVRREGPATARDTLRLSLDETAFDAAIAAAQTAGDRILWSGADRRRGLLLTAHLEGPDGHRIVLVRALGSNPPAVARRKKAAASAG
jgi:catechol 2,3-dioxygenase-like lactoylglutathione lyase family enzyme